MQKQFEITQQFRGATLGIIENLSDEQLLTIPEGFKNNILWNLGHMVVSHQYFVYAPSGLDVNIPEAMAADFGRGTSPSDWASTPDITEIKALAMTTMAQLEADIKDNKFQNYGGMNVGVQLETVEDAATFICFHEGEHFGIIKALANKI